MLAKVVKYFIYGAGMVYIEVLARFKEHTDTAL